MRMNLGKEGELYVDAIYIDNGWTYAHGEGVRDVVEVAGSS